MNKAQDKPVALITGSGRPRIGKRIAQSLGERGYRIAVHYKSSEDGARKVLSEFRDLGIDAEAFHADVSKEADVERMFEAVMAPPGLSEEELQARIDATLVKDADDPETMVRTVLYFIDNSFLTGVCLPVDGGRTIYAGSSG